LKGILTLLLLNHKSIMEKAILKKKFYTIDKPVNVFQAKHEAVQLIHYHRFSQLLLNEKNMQFKRTT